MLDIILEIVTVTTPFLAAASALKLGGLIP